MNLRDKRSSGSVQNENQENTKSIMQNSNESRQDLIQRQQEVISELSSRLQTSESDIQTLRSELQKRDEKIVLQNEEIVRLNGKIEQLNKSDIELQESRKIMDSVSKEKAAVAHDKYYTDWQKKENEKESRRLAKWRLEIAEIERDQENVVRKRVDRELENRKLELSKRIAKEWHSSLLLIVYAVIMTIYYVVLHWETVVSGEELFVTRLVTIIKGIWLVAWPAVYNYWFDQIQADTGSLIATIVTAVLAAGAILGLAVLFLKWKRVVDDTYEDGDKRKAETAVLIVLSTLVFSLIICSRNPVEMSWMMLWILLAFGVNFVFQTGRIFWIRKYPYKKRRW